MLPAGAEDDITIKPDEVIRAEPGSVVTIAEESVRQDLVGRTCELRVTAENGASVHPGNVVVTTSGDSRVETPGVEDGSGQSVVDLQPIELGETIVIQLRMGPDGLSSLGFSVAVDCAEPPLAPVTSVPDEPTRIDPPVLPAQQTAPPLPQTPAADPTVGDPTFTG